MDKIVLGDGFVDGVTQGPLINKPQFDKVNRNDADKINPRVGAFEQCYWEIKLKPELSEIRGSKDMCCITKN